MVRIMKLKISLLPRQVAVSDPLTILKVANYTDFIFISQVQKRFFLLEMEMNDKKIIKFPKTITDYALQKNNKSLCRQ